MGRLIFSLISILLTSFSLCQEKNLTITLDQAIALSNERSSQSAVRENRASIRKYDHLLFKASLLPRVSFNGGLLDFNRSFNPVIQPDGNTEFRAISNNNSNMNFTVDQAVPFTGGTLFIQSNTNRFDNFNDEIARYNGTPFSIGYRHQITGLNSYRWDKKLQKIAEDESRAIDQNERFEIISLILGLFFDLLLAQTDLDLAEKRLELTDTLHFFSKQEYDVGKLLKKNMLESEIALVTSKQNFERANYELAIALEKFNNFLKLTNTDYKLIEPYELPSIEVSREELVFHASGKNLIDYQYLRQQLQTEREIRENKSGRAPQLDFSVNIGQSSTAEDFLGLYRSPQNQQRINLSLSMPIINWKQSTYRTERLLARQAIETINYQEESAQLALDISERLFRLKRVDRELQLIAERQRLGEEELRITSELYLNGKVDFVDVLRSQNVQRETLKERLSLIRSFWENYYTLQKMTLFDMAKGEKID